MHDKLHIKTAHTGKVLSSVSIELQFIRTSVHATHDAWPCCVCVWKGAVMTARCVVAKSGLLCPSNDRDEKKKVHCTTLEQSTQLHTLTQTSIFTLHTHGKIEMCLKIHYPPPPVLYTFLNSHVLCSSYRGLNTVLKAENTENHSRYINMKFCTDTDGIREHASYRCFLLCHYKAVRTSASRLKSL